MDAINKQLISIKDASRLLRSASTKKKNLFLEKLAESLVRNSDKILEENAKDLQTASGLNLAMKNG